MRKLPQWLAFFFIVTQVDRVAHFINLYQPANNTFYFLLSYGISIGLAVGVYVSFFYLRQQKVKWASIAGVILFGGFDLFFNEFALIRTVSAKALISADSSFAWIPAEYLQVATQIAALAYGLLPTLASAILGWIQGGVDKLTDAEMKPTVWMRFGRSFVKMFDTIAVRFAVGFEATASRFSGVAVNPRGNDEPVAGEILSASTPKRWPALSKEDVAFITGNGRGAISARFAVSDRTAGNWKQWVADGNMPWNAGKLPEGAEK